MMAEQGQRVGEGAGDTGRTVTLADSGVNAAIRYFIIFLYRPY